MQLGARDHARSYHLHKLATALDTEGFHATVKTSYPAALHVFMPGASMLTESIDCVPGTDGRVLSIPACASSAGAAPVG